MSLLPRVAIGTLQAESMLAPVHWALLDVLAGAGVQTQCFQSRACFTPFDGATAVTGLKPRHLDSWLMSRDFCREIFFRAARTCDLAVVDGSLAPGESGLSTLCEWLDLPRMAVLDVLSISQNGWPVTPFGVDGIILDRVRDDQHADEITTRIATRWNLPVLGWLEELPVLREIVAALSPGSPPSRELCAALGRKLATHFQRKAFLNLAARRSFGEVPNISETNCTASVEPLHVAIAFDEAFHCYFPDMLDLLELRGAIVRDFSPLHDETLPANTDIVYLGCGHPHAFAEALSQNHCLMAAIRNHVFSGKRVYAESGGLAYLCRELQLPDGTSFPMVGAIPATARLNPTPTPPRPVELSLVASSWLGPTGETIRGYLNTMWEVEPAGPSLTTFAAERNGSHEMVGRRQAIGSRLHLHLAALPGCLQRFWKPVPVSV